MVISRLLGKNSETESGYNRFLYKLTGPDVSMVNCILIVFLCIDYQFIPAFFYDEFASQFFQLKYSIYHYY